MIGEKQMIEAALVVQARKRATPTSALPTVPSLMRAYSRKSAESAPAEQPENFDGDEMNEEGEEPNN